MRSFTETTNPNATRRDEVIDNFVAASGMERTAAVRMFESYQAFGSNMEEINDHFYAMVHPETTNPLAIFADESTVFDDNTFNTKASNAIKEFVRQQPYDCVGLLNIMANVLRVKNPEFAPIFNKLEICNDIPEISHYSEMAKGLNENAPAVVNGTVALYESLKDVLAKNNKRFGISYHIENVYNEIWNYLTEEIDKLTVASSITSKSDDFKRGLVDSLMRSSLNPMYFSRDYIVNSCPDVQGVVFDMMAIVECWKNTIDPRIFSMVNSKVLRDYHQAVEALYSSITSSAANSVVVARVEDGSSSDCCYNSRLYFVANNYVQSCLYSGTFEIHSVIDALQIIKNLSGDFNLTIRPAIHTFVSKAWNLVGRAEHLLYEVRKINKYKN